MYLRFILLSLAFFFLHKAGQTQTTTIAKSSANNIYLDGTVGIFSQGSINYERKVVGGEKLNLYGRIGAGASINTNGGTGPGGLFALTMLTGARKHHFELGLGTFIGAEGGGTFVHPVFNAGYRFQKPEGGFIFRTHLGLLSIGIGAGYAF